MLMLLWWKSVGFIWRKYTVVEWSFFKKHLFPSCCSCFLNNLHFKMTKSVQSVLFYCSHAAPPCVLFVTVSPQCIPKQLYHHRFPKASTTFLFLQVLKHIMGCRVLLSGTQMFLSPNALGAERSEVAATRETASSWFNTSFQVQLAKGAWVKKKKKSSRLIGQMATL